MEPVATAFGDTVALGPITETADHVLLLLRLRLLRLLLGLLLLLRRRLLLLGLVLVLLVVVDRGDLYRLLGVLYPDRVIHLSG